MNEGGSIVLTRSDRTEIAPLDFRFRVLDWAAVTPESAMEPALPQLLRRRITPLGQMAFRAVASLPQQADTRFVFSSRHGEFERTLRLLHGLAAREPLSPAEFALSVPNALAGLLSMAWRNRAGHTTIAAGEESFAFGLLEAAGCLAASGDKKVLLVHFDAPLPGEYDTFNSGDEAGLALALLLAPPSNANEDVVLSYVPAARRGTGNLAVDFARFLAAPAQNGNGARSRWRWCRAG